MLISFYSLTKSIVFRPQGQGEKAQMSALVLEALVPRDSDLSFRTWAKLVTIQIPLETKNFKCPLYQMFSEADGCLPDCKLGLLESPLQKINHNLVRRLPLQQKDRISAVLNCSQSQSLCYPNVCKNSLVSVLALLCRGFHSPNEALQELKDVNLVTFLYISSTTQST